MKTGFYWRTKNVFGETIDSDTLFFFNGMYLEICFSNGTWNYLGLPCAAEEFEYIEGL